MSPRTDVVPEHPATFSRKILDRIRTMLAEEATRVGQIRVLDPFAGVGTIHELAEETIETVGVELQPEWAAIHPDTVCGNVLDVVEMFGEASFDCIASSPSYANRMADHHDAAERCSRCGGRRFGGVLVVPGEPDRVLLCEACGGTGKRDHHRNTYAHKLREAGTEPVDSRDNTQLMPWGQRYVQFHRDAWRACDRVLRRGGLVVLNVKNHYRGQELIRVVEFHLNEFLALGYTIEEARKIPTRGLAVGANASRRTGFEIVMALRAPA